LAIWFTDVNTGTAVGTNGTILRTTNGGLTWTPQTSGTTEHLRAVHFADANTGMAVTSGSAGLQRDEIVLKTVDGGATWVRMTTPTPPTGDGFVLHDVRFVDASTAFVVGNYVDPLAHWISYFLQTTDGGATWARVFSADGGRNDLYAITYVGGNDLLAVGELGTIHRTTDLGANWSRIGGSRRPMDVRGVDFIDANHGVAAENGYDSGNQRTEMCYTADGGNTWTLSTVSDALGPMSMLDVTFASETDVYAVGLGETGIDYYGTIIKSEDGGLTWNGLYSDWCPAFCTDPLYLRSVSFGSSIRGVAVGEYGGIVVINNDVVTRVTSPLPVDLLDVSMPDANTAVAVGVGGTILRSTNGGATWSVQTSGTAVDLHAVWFIDALTGWVVGTAGTILHTDDGGLTWIPQLSVTSEWLFGVRFVTASTGVAVGNNGVVLITYDGGLEWVSEYTVAQYALYDVAIADGKTTAVGGGNTIVGRLDPITGIDDQPPVVSASELYNEPNPFNPTTTIHFSLDHAQRVELVVYDVHGKYVATLFDGPRGAGEQRVRWNGRADDGRAVASGVYFCSLRTGAGLVTRKMVLLR
jgi:photosystem II stability/assembly factor-like uncharacterized protein